MSPNFTPKPTRFQLAGDSGSFQTTSQFTGSSIWSYRFALCSKLYAIFVPTIFISLRLINKMAGQYEKESISALSRKEYLKFFRDLFPLFKEHSKKDACIAFLNSDWRDFSGKAAREEDPRKNILDSDYIKLLERSGWEISHLIDCPLSSQRFKPNQVRRMQNNRTLGVVRRYLIVGMKK